MNNYWEIVFPYFIGTVVAFGVLLAFVYISAAIGVHHD